MSKMKEIRIEKMTLNVGAGKDQNRLKKGVMLLKHLTGIEPVKTVTRKRIPSWGLRPGLPIGCKLTLRKNISELLKKFLAAKENNLSEENFDDSGNVSFGIHEYIDIPGVKYDPEIGITGFQISVTLARQGYRVKKRRLLKSKIGKNHIITRGDAIGYFKKNYGVEIEEE